MTKRELTRNTFLCFLAYLYGSVPLIYLLARRRGVDLRATGSGNVGATNFSAGAGLLPAALGWIFDASKGFLPVRIAARSRLSEATGELAGACGAAGQCWPVFLRFAGGRGISTFVGVSLAVDPAVATATVLPMAAGGLLRLATSGKDRSRWIPLGSLLALIAFPLACAMRKRPFTAPVLLSAMLIVRRLTAPLPDDAVRGPGENPRALLFRLLYDRNTER